MLVPAGQVDSRDSREPWLNDDPAAVIEATAVLGMTAGLPIDYDHAIELAAPKGLPAPAAGWIKKLRVQDGAIWGDVEWTEPGAKAVASGEWRYISPVLDFAEKTRRITCVLRASLTNNPALFGTAIAASRLIAIGRSISFEGGSDLRRTPSAEADGRGNALTHSERQVINSLTGVTPAELAAHRGKRLKLTFKSQFSK